MDVGERPMAGPKVMQGPEQSYGAPKGPSKGTRIYRGRWRGVHSCSRGRGAVRAAMGGGLWVYGEGTHSSQVFGSPGVEALLPAQGGVLLGAEASCSAGSGTRPICVRARRVVMVKAEARVAAHARCSPWLPRDT